MANGECIPYGRRRARANWDVVGHCAEGSNSAGTWTRILTLGPDASLRLGAIGVHQALRLTAFVGVSSVARNALAVRAIVSLSAVSVDTAGRRTAGS